MLPLSQMFINQMLFLVGSDQSGRREVKSGRGFVEQSPQTGGDGTRTGTGFAPRGTRLMHQPDSGLGSVCCQRISGKREQGCAQWP